MQLFISTKLLRKTDGEGFEIRVSQPEELSSHPDWSVEISSIPTVRDLNTKIIGANHFQCIHLAAKYIREFIVANDYFTVHPGRGSLNTEFPEFIPYSLGDEFYAKVSAKVSELWEAKQRELTERRLSKYSE